MQPILHAAPDEVDAALAGLVLRASRFARRYWQGCWPVTPARPTIRRFFPACISGGVP